MWLNQADYPKLKLETDEPRLSGGFLGSRKATWKQRIHQSQ